MYLKTTLDHHLALCALMSPPTEHNGTAAGCGAAGGVGAVESDTADMTKEQELGRRGSQSQSPSTASSNSLTPTS